MEQTCTCGATVSANARFCPMCGRPLGEETTPSEREEMTAPPFPGEPDSSAAADSVSPSIGFGNYHALRSCYLGALVAALLGNIPVLNLLCFIWYPAAGFISVYSYRKRIGISPAIRGGAKLGWMTGVLTFIISLVLFAAVMLVAGEDANIAQAMQEQINEMPGNPAMKEEMRELLKQPFTIAFIFLTYLAISFLLTVGLTAVGGALGAKILEKD